MKFLFRYADGSTSRCISYCRIVEEAPLFTLIYGKITDESLVKTKSIKTQCYFNFDSFLADRWD